MGLFSAIASIFGGANKKAAIGAASNAQLGAINSGINSLYTGQTQGIDALNLGRDSAITTLNNAQSGAIPELDAQMGANNSDLQATLAGFAPWLTAGQGAITSEGNLAGLNGNDPQAAAIAALKASPLFQSLMANGNNNILANGSATGGLRGGNIQHSLAQFGTDTLSQVIQQQLANLGGIAGQGLAAGQAGSAARLGTDNLNTTLAGGKASILTGTGTNIANLQDSTGTAIAQLLANNGINVAALQGQGGQVAAGGILGKANADGGIFGSIASGLGGLVGAIPGLNNLPAFGTTLGKLI